MPSYPLANYGPTISATGISIPTYNDVLLSLQAEMRQIYGDDIYIEPDSMDGQWLAIQAKAITDCNQGAVAVYNSFSPQTAFGAGLSNVVKINHLKRAVATNSQVNVLLVGQAGTTITSGQVADTEGNKWLLPPTVTIPPAGDILVTATAAEVGAIHATSHSVTKILTPTAGWQSVDNADPATPGQPVESDAELRARQVIAPATNSNTVLTGLAAALGAIPGVSYGTIYENDTDTTDTDGLPAHSIAVVIKGGDVNVIAQTIYQRKAPGVATYGTTTVNVPDISGAMRPINFSVPTEKEILVEVGLYADTGYTTAVANEIKAAIVNFINALSVGEDVICTRIYSPALLFGAQDGETYKLSYVKIAFGPSGTPGTADLTITLTQKATCITTDITIVTL